MFCKYCGKPIDDGSLHCPYCGKGTSEQIPYAPRTQTPLPEDAPFASSVPTASDSHKKPKPIKRTSSAKKLLIPLCVVMCFILMFATGAGIILIRTGNKELSANDIAKLSDSVLTLYVYNEHHEPISNGSGFAVQDDRTVVTNYHVIENGYYVEAHTEDETVLSFEGITYYDKATDVAVLRLDAPGELKPLPLAEFSSVSVGDTVYAIGSPLGLSGVVSEGIISAIREDDPEYDLQITAPISSGSSGGALINAYGEVIGITSAGYNNAQNLNFAVSTARFSDHLNNRVIQEFANVTEQNPTIGNTVENYSVYQTRLVQYRHMTFESYNARNDIHLHNSKTGTDEKLGIRGTNLSVYDGLLYYVCDNTLNTYNIETGEIKQDILKFYASTDQVQSISKVFVTKHGISVIYEAGATDHDLIQLGFDKTVIGIVHNLPADVVPANDQTLIGYEYETWELVTVSLNDLKIGSVPLPFQPGKLCVSSDNMLYITDTTDSDNVCLMKFDFNTTQCTPIHLPYSLIYGCFVHDGKLLYPSEVGTVMISADKTDVTIVSSAYAMNTICAANDGTLYAIGRAPYSPTDPNAYDDYTEYYLRFDPESGYTQVLDSEHIA